MSDTSVIVILSCTISSSLSPHPPFVFVFLSSGFCQVLALVALVCYCLFCFVCLEFQNIPLRKYSSSKFPSFYSRFGLFGFINCLILLPPPSLLAVHVTSRGMVELWNPAQSILVNRAQIPIVRGGGGRWANRVDLGFLFQKFSNFTPPPPKAAGIERITKATITAPFLPNLQDCSKPPSQVGLISCHINDSSQLGHPPHTHTGLI